MSFADQFNAEVKEIDLTDGTVVEVLTDIVRGAPTEVRATKAVGVDSQTAYVVHARWKLVDENRIELTPVVEPTPSPAEKVRTRLVIFGEG